jgi:hypothetical protein
MEQPIVPMMQRTFPGQRHRVRATLSPPQAFAGDFLSDTIEREFSILLERDCVTGAGLANFFNIR